MKCSLPSHRINFIEEIGQHISFSLLVVYQRIKVELSNDKLGLLHQLHDKRICLLTTQARLLKVLILMINVFRLPFHHNHNKSVKLNQQFSAESVQIYESNRKKSVYISALEKFTFRLHCMHLLWYVCLSMLGIEYIYVDKLSLVPFDWCHRNSFVFYIHCNCNRNHLAYRIFSFFSYAVFWFISESILRLNCIPAAATIILLFLMFILLLSAYRIYAHQVSIEMWVHLA